MSKYEELPNPLIERVGETGVEAVVTGIESRRAGHILARTKIRRGERVLTANDLELDLGNERTRLAGKALKADASPGGHSASDGAAETPGGDVPAGASRRGEPLTREAIDQALLRLAEQVRLLGPPLATGPAHPASGLGDQSAGCPYEETEAGLVHWKPTKEGPVPVPLTNFTARIVGDISQDDGAEVRRAFEITATLRGRETEFEVPATQFGLMGWVLEHLGAGAILSPGLSSKDHARCAIQTLSGQIPRRQVYCHIGWRKIDGAWLYLHAGGAIGRDGAVDGIEVSLPGTLGEFLLVPPDDEEDLRSAVQASLKVLELIALEVAVPLYSAIWRSVLGGVDFGIHVAGPTGQGKSAVVALCQQHFGAEFSFDHLPASWSSTANANEGLAFAAKDACLAIDDFAPTGSTSDIQRMHGQAERIFRAQGNGSGRARMKADSSLRASKPPRGLVLSTGEDIPRGQSIRARIVILEIGPGELNFLRLTSFQSDAKAGLYAKAMAGFVRWLSKDYDAAQLRARELGTQLRDEANQSPSHRRTPHNVAELGVGLRFFLDFAAEIGAITQTQAEEKWTVAWHALGECAARQSRHQGASEPTARFIELLSSAIISGQAHISDFRGEKPGKPSRWGWRYELSGSTREWRPQGAKVGWTDEDNLYLDLEAAFAAAQKMAREGGDPLAVGSQTLTKRLHEKGLLLTTDASRQTLSVRKMLEHSRRNVLHLCADTLRASGEDDDDDLDDSMFDLPPELPATLGSVVPPKLSVITTPGSSKALAHGDQLRRDPDVPADDDSEADNGTTPDGVEQELPF